MRKIKTAVAFNSILKEDLRNPKIKEAYDFEDLISDVAIQIAQLREESNLSQKDLARMLRIKQQSVSKIENAKQNISLKTLFHIAKVFHKRPQLEFV